jgi:hypothetical protein
MNSAAVFDDEWIMKIQLLSESNHLLRRFAGAGNYWYSCRLQTTDGWFRR